MNLAYLRVNPNVSKLKRLAVSIDTEDKDRHEIKTSSWPETKSSVTINFKPKRRMLIPSEYTFEVTCKSPAKLTIPLDLTNFKTEKPKLGLVDLWIDKQYHTVKQQEMWMAITSKLVTVQDKDKRFMKAGHYTKIDEIVMLMNKILVFEGQYSRIRIGQSNKVEWYFQEGTDIMFDGTKLTLSDSLTH